MIRKVQQTADIPGPNKMRDSRDWVGMLMAYRHIVIGAAEAEGILRLDCQGTDYDREGAFPAYLCYNPHQQKLKCRMETGTTEPIRVYDAVSHTFLTERMTGPVELALPATAVILAIVVPADEDVIEEGRQRFVNGIIIDYNITV
ncbi:hypothetical protein [Paenibacillus nasutitermitis]|uniref:Uncharacterized protein n=1 Tax=Paenibacillus nasutitermitis TaxID=1652958 RepID=A0A916ZA75_9BACL|nr:hypothetical protein [Paenibacillus nasutitermitis]GGD84000.1 hypothetical protein GCM10010911_47780 [Paenibacillus nasutitermitis]